MVINIGKALGGDWAYVSDEIKQVMRYAGPRMLGKHPVAAVRHLLGK